MHRIFYVIVIMLYSLVSIYKYYYLISIHKLNIINFSYQVLLCIYTPVNGRVVPDLMASKVCCIIIIIKGQKKATVSYHTLNRVYTN